MLLVVKVDVLDVDVPTMVLSEVLAAFSCHLMTWIMCWKQTRDVTMCLGPNGVVVDEVDQAVCIAVHRPTDGCLIKQMRTADRKCVDLLEDVLCCRTLDDTHDVRCH